MLAEGLPADQCVGTGKISRTPCPGELPYTVEIQRSVREIVRLQQRDEHTLYGKTGWATPTDPDIGCWVGWVVKDEDVYSFALNIDMQDKDDIGKRIELGKACLKVPGIF